MEIQYWNSGIIAIGSGGCISILKLVRCTQMFFSEFHFAPSCHSYVIKFSKTHGYFEFLDLPLPYVLHPIVANLHKYCALAFLRAWVIGTQALKKQRSTANSSTQTSVPLNSGLGRPELRVGTSNLGHQ